MSFTIGDLLRKVPATEKEADAKASVEQLVEASRPMCATGKHVYASKQAARAHLRKVNGRENAGQRAFRCPLCFGIHIGHRRGTHPYE